MPKDSLLALMLEGKKMKKNCCKLPLIKAVLFWVIEVNILFRNVCFPLPTPFSNMFNLG